MRALLLALALVIVPMKSFACSCATPPAPKRAVETSVAVFTGKVTKVERVTADGTRTPFDPKKDLAKVDADMKAGKPFPTDQIEVTFAVDRSWKGVEKGTVVVNTGVPVCCICIPEFREGESWMIYATDEGGALTTSRCSRSTDLKNATKDLKALGKPVKTF